MSEEQFQMPGSMQENLDTLILLEQVEEAHKKETQGWFKSLLKIVVSQVASNDIPLFFEQYEEMYKEKTGETKMPSTYRSAKTVINQGIEYGCYYDKQAHSEQGSSIRDCLLGKSAIEKEVKRIRASQPATNEELLSTIISCTNKIRDSLDTLNPDSKAYKGAINYLQVEIGQDL